MDLIVWYMLACFQLPTMDTKKFLPTALAEIRHDKSGWVVISTGTEKVAWLRVYKCIP
jgi:hypothetical protein